MYVYLFICIVNIFFELTTKHTSIAPFTIPFCFLVHPHPHKKPQHHGGGGGGGSGSGNGNNGGDKSSHAENTTAFDTDDSSGDDDADSKPLSNDFKNFGFDDKSNENSSGQKDNEPLQISPTLIGGAMVATLAVMTAAASMMVQIVSAS